MTDDDYANLAEKISAQRPPGPFWLFAYGSLLWNPEFEVAESHAGTVRGYHRSFCFTIERGRGSIEKPGLMMALDRGGQCLGRVFHLPEGSLLSTLERLLRREIIVKPWINVPVWVNATTPAGAVKALTFVVDRESPRNVGRLETEVAADILATAAGHRGTCAEYLLNTVDHLEQLGIRDRNL
jgi:cation transport protein ChaC